MSGKENDGKNMTTFVVKKTNSSFSVIRVLSILDWHLLLAPFRPIIHKQPCCCSFGTEEGSQVSNTQNEKHRPWLAPTLSISLVLSGLIRYYKLFIKHHEELPQISLPKLQWKVHRSFHHA